MQSKKEIKITYFNFQVPHFCDHVVIMSFVDLQMLYKCGS